MPVSRPTTTPWSGMILTFRSPQKSSTSRCPARRTGPARGLAWTTAVPAVAPRLRAQPGGAASKVVARPWHPIRSTRSGAEVSALAARERNGCCQSGRQDLNLRPPGPQPGALPDCATPRGAFVCRAGDGNRTRPKSLEGSCATTTLRPPAVSRPRDLGRPGAAPPSGHVPSSSARPGGGQGPGPVVDAAVERHDRAAERAAHAATPAAPRASANSCIVPEPLQRHAAGRARGSRPPGTCSATRSRSGRSPRRPRRRRADAQRGGQLARQRLHRRPRRARCAPSPASRGAGETVTLTIVPPRRPRIAPSTAACVIVSVPSTFSRCTAAPALGARCPRRGRSTGRRRC